MGIETRARITLVQNWLVTVFTCLLFCGIILAEKAPALLSVFMAGQILSILILTHPKKIFMNLVNDKAVLLFAFSYLFLLLSFFYSDNLSYLAERLRIKLPLLLYALIVPSINPLNSKQKNLIYYCFIAIVSITVAGVLINYSLHYEAINQLYLESKIMPAPLNHIRFSLLVVFSICLCHYKITLPNIRFIEKTTLIFLTLFLVTFLHIYSVRSGLLSFYIVFAFLLLLYVIKTKNIKLALIVIFIVGIIGLGSVLLSPTLKNKIINTNADVQVYNNNEDPNYNSLATRMVSYKVAFEILKENILLGCGQGDLKDESDRLFKLQYPTIVTPIIPHNQFIYYLAATGIIGLLIFTVCFTAPLWYAHAYKNQLLLISYLILLISFQFEPMIETQLGVVCTVLIIFLPYYLYREKTKVLTYK